MEEDVAAMGVNEGLEGGSACLIKTAGDRPSSTSPIIILSLIHFYIKTVSHFALDFKFHLIQLDQQQYFDLQHISNSINNSANT